MSDYNFMRGSAYGSPLRSPQDACWDTLCPLNVKSSNPGQEKLACLKNNMDKVCDCCHKGSMPDCEILIPGQGLVDPCKLVGRGSGGAKDHFCDCIKEVCPNCRGRDAFLKNQQPVIDCCQGKCTGGSCDYDCNQIALNYLAPNSLMGSCLPEKRAPPAPTAPVTTTKKQSGGKSSFFEKNQMWFYITGALILAIIAVFVVGYFMKKKKKGKRRR